MKLLDCLSVNRTLVIVKPDGVERGLVGEIVSRLEQRQLRLVAAELRTIDEATAERHYAEHEGKPFFDPLVTFITRSPSLVGDRGARGRLEGRTHDDGHDESPRRGARDVRGDLALQMSENLDPRLGLGRIGRS